jgi:hypothetical protein
MHICRSAVIVAPIDRVWTTLRHFDGVVRWNPGVAEAAIEDGGRSDRAGCVRRLVLSDGGVIRETLLAISDVERFFSYDIVESPLPVTNYIATQRFMPITQTDQTFASWEVHFDVASEHAAAMARVIGVEIFEQGLDGMQRHFGG